jgi:hypothetical protein
VRYELLRRDLADKEEKAVTRQTAAEGAKSAALASTNEVLSLIGQLADQTPQGWKLKPDASKSFGARMPFVGKLPMGGWTDANARIEKLRGKAVLDLIAEMKRQSATGATGFGAMNIRELELLERSASLLTNANISDEAAAQEMGRIAALVQGIQSRVGSGGVQQVPAPSGPRRVGRFEIVSEN